MRRFFVFLIVVVAALGLTLAASAQKSKGKDQPKSAESSKIEDLVSKGEYQKAIDLANKFIAAGQVTEGLYIDLGVAYYNMKQYDQAIKACEEASKLNPFGTQALLYEATCYHELKQEDKVAEVYQKVLAIDPTNKEVHYDLAQLDEAQKKPDDAIKEYKAIYWTDEATKAENDPAFKDVAYALGLIYYNKGETDAAEIYLDKAVSLNPPNADEVLLAQGQNYIKAKKYDKAVVPLQKYLDVTKSDNLKPAVTATVAGVYVKSALAATDSVKGSKDKDAIAKAEAAAKQDYTQAIVYFDKLLVLRPDSEKALLGKADALLQIGKNSDAIPVLKQYLAVSKNDAEKKKVSDLLKQLEAGKK